MKFNKVKIFSKNNFTDLLSWNYLKSEEPSNSFFIRIGIAGTDKGPFQTLVELPLSTVVWENIREKKKWEVFYYKIEILNTFETLDSRIVRIEPLSDASVQKVRAKYDLYLKNKVRNPITFFKKKEIGNKCPECFDGTKSVKINCKTCFGTGYGNDTRLNLSNLTVDGWLKMNSDEDLEFTKRGWTFDQYPNNNSLLIDYGIKPGDEFRVENMDGDPLLSLPIKAVNYESLVLTYNKDLFSYLDNSVFSVYHLEPIRTEKVDVRICQDGENYRLYGLINLSLDFNKIVINDVEYTLDKYEDYILIHTTDELKKFSSFYLKSDDTVARNYLVNSIFFSKFEYQSYWDNNTYVATDRFYIDYYFDGVDRINGKIISESHVDGMSMAFFSVTDFVDGIAVLKLETLSHYENIKDFSEEYYNICIQRFLRQNIVLNSFNIKKSYAHQKTKVRIFNENTKFKLKHKNILKTTFKGCGVIAINLKTGIAYYGPVWHPTHEEYVEAGDFYVDPSTGEVDTLNLPQGLYEFSYIYALDKIKFDSYFLPLEPKFRNKELITCGGWKFKHPELKKVDVKGTMLGISGRDKYEEFEIRTYREEAGILFLANKDIDINNFWNSLFEDSTFNLVEPNTGGYYKSIPGYITFLDGIAKEKMFTDDGMIANYTNSAITSFYPTLEVDDVIFDEKMRIFYSILKIDVPTFRRNELFQRLFLKYIPPEEQSLLFKLLER